MPTSTVVSVERKATMILERAQDGAVTTEQALAALDRIEADAKTAKARNAIKQARAELDTPSVDDDPLGDLFAPMSDEPVAVVQRKPAAIETPKTAIGHGVTVQGAWKYTPKGETESKRYSGAPVVRLWADAAPGYLTIKGGAIEALVTALSDPKCAAQVREVLASSQAAWDASA